MEVERRKGGFELDPLQKEDMKAVGEILRLRRAEMHLSLKEAENATSIRIAYLQALEEGEMNKLISPIYAQGFFKQYASFLGIDGEQIVRDNPGVFSRPEVQEFAYGIGTLEGRGNPGAGVKWFPNALWILTFVIILLLAWYVARLLGVIG
jgi:cytoskeletal protein RodZ